MSVLSAIKTRLVSEVTAITTGASGNIFYEVAKEGQDRPFVILSQDSREGRDTKIGASELDQVQVSVQYYGDSVEGANGCNTLAQAGRTALDQYYGVLDTETVQITFINEFSNSWKQGNKRAYVMEQVYDVEITR